MENILHEQTISKKEIITKNTQILPKVLLELIDGRLAYSNDSCIKIKQLNQGQPKIILYSPEETISSLIQLTDQTIVSGYKNGALCLLNVDSIKPKKISTGHTLAVLCLLQSHYYNLLFSGSSDSTVKVWDLSTMNCLTTLKHHKDAVTCLLELYDMRLATSSLDKTIRIFKQPKYTLSAIIDTRIKIYSMIQVTKSHIAFGVKKQIYLWNFLSRKCNQKVNDSKVNPIFLLTKLSNGMLASFSKHSISIWNWSSNGYVEHEKIECEDQIYSMVELNDHRIAYLSFGNLIKYHKVRPTKTIQRCSSLNKKKERDHIYQELYSKCVRTVIANE